MSEPFYAERGGIKIAQVPETYDVLLRDTQGNIVRLSLKDAHNAARLLNRAKQVLRAKRRKERQAKKHKPEAE